MNARSFYLTLCAILLTLTSSVHSQTFTSLHGPRGADWSPITVEKDGTLYMQIFYNAYESTDHGTSWHAVRTHDMHRVSFTMDSAGFMYASDTAYGLVRSIDRGRTWEPLSDLKGWDPGPFLVSNRAIYVPGDSFGVSGSVTGRAFISSDHGAHFRSLPLPTWIDVLFQSAGVDSSNNMYMSTTFNGWYRSTNDGETWIKMTQLISASGVVDAIVTDSKNHLYARVTDNNTVAQIYRSDDQGASWQFRGSISPEYDVGSMNAIGSDTLIIVNIGGFSSDSNLTSIIRSFDGGKTWNRAKADFGNSNIGVTTSGTYDPVSRALLIDEFTSGHWRSTDLGDHFESMDAGIFQSNITNLIRTKSGALLAVNDYQNAFRYASGQWNEFSNLVKPLGIESSGLGFVRTHTGDIMYWTHGDIYRSNDEGVTWSKQFGRFDPSIAHGSYGNVVSAGSIVADSNGGLYAVLVETTNLAKKGLARSLDLGSTWTKLSLPNSDSLVQTVEVAPDGSVYASGANTLYRSRDQGANWSVIKQFSHPVVSIAIPTANALLIGVDSEGVQLTTDNGTNWSVVLTPPLDQRPVQVAVPAGPITNSTPLFATVRVDTSDHAIVATFYPFRKWIGYVSTDLGQHWSQLPDSIGARSIQFVNSTQVEIGTWNNGVYEMKIDSKGVAALTPYRPDISLSPNPTSGVVHIDLSTARSNTKVEVFDERGAVVLTLSKNGQPTKTLLLDTAKLVTGHYEVRISAGEDVVTKSLVVVR